MYCTLHACLNFDNIHVQYLDMYMYIKEQLLTILIKLVIINY